jgi:hypothetical protein
VVCAAVQVAEACTKLYQFWESFQDAPEDVAAIVESLRYLSTVFEEIASAKKPLAPSVAEGIRCCQRKVAVRYLMQTFDLPPERGGSGQH